MNKKKLSLIVFIIGLITLVGGITALILSFVLKPNMRDAEYLVSMDKWVLQPDVEVPEGSEANVETIDTNVIWKFTEIGKGTLTTNNHINDYDFIWAIDGDTLKVETKWFYELNNEYTYKIDQGAKTLTLTTGETEYRFKGYEKQEETPTETTVEESSEG